MNKLNHNNCILKYSDYVIIAAEEPLPKAIHAVLSLIDLTKINLKVGITSANSFNEDYRRNIITLLTEQCLNIIVLWFGSKDEWDNLGWNKIAGNVIIKADGIADLVNIINSNISTSEWRRVKLLNRLYASVIYDLIRNFGHNSKSDITNQLLAPIRMLLIENKYEFIKAFIDDQKTEKILNLFENDVCSRIDYTHGYYGLMIREYWIAIYKGLNECNAGKSQEIINNIDKFMLLLSECRVQAGENVQHIRSDRKVFNSEKDDSKRRILVIDDDIETWILTLCSLSKRIGENVQIFVSKDATKLSILDDYPSEKKLDIKQCLPDFDIVLLDIYLKDQKGADLNGLDFLADIREKIMHLPVILWTTSTEKELPAEAALANGFIFKKTATIESIASTLLAWLSIGKSQRLWSLPNPYFDYALRNPSLREVALAFTKWTLRYMDCFHAIDHFYFKYFNDHGGRHILGVLDTASKLLRPFLFDDSLLHKCPVERNKQIFCLYIAILCHEFGMFPIYKGEDASHDEDFWEKLECMRKLHGIRGMLMLRAEVDQTLYQYNVEGLGKYLEFLKDIQNVEVIGVESRAVIALLVGYHQRCLDLSSADESYYTEPIKFEEKNGALDDNSTAKGKINSAYNIINNDKINWTVWDTVTKSITNSWTDALGQPNTTWTLTSIRRLCAILRFADALDVDHTRVPADFIINDTDNKRRAMQDVEDCKRQVLSSVELDQGVVCLQFFADLIDLNNSNYTDYFKNIISGVHKLPDMNDKDLKDFKKLSALSNKDDEPSFIQILNDTNYYKIDEQIIQMNLNPYNDIWYENGCVNNLEKYLKGCLFLHFLNLKYINNYFNDNKLLKFLALSAALLVVFEIMDEYKAIQEVGLHDKIVISKEFCCLGPPYPSILNGKKK